MVLRAADIKSPVRVDSKAKRVLEKARGIVSWIYGSKPFPVLLIEHHNTISRRITDVDETILFIHTDTVG